MSSSSRAEATDARVHDIQDKMDDLGFPVSAVDGIEAALNQKQGAWDAAAPLGRILGQVLSDLAAFAHGCMRMPTDNLQQEVFAALEEEGFPYASLLSSGSSFLDSTDGRILALDFLLSQLQAARMLALATHKQQQQQQQQQQAHVSAKDSTSKKRVGSTETDAGDSSKRPRGSAESASASAAVLMEDVAPASVNSDDAEVSTELRLLAHTLQVVLPPSSSGSAALRTLHIRLAAWLRESPSSRSSVTLAPLFSQSSFSPLQLSVVTSMFASFLADYSLRVQVLRTRLDVTLQSFVWGGKGVECEDAITRMAAAKLAAFPRTPNVCPYDLWSATPLVLSIARLTSRDYALRSSIKRVIIGAVPDRGGRVDQTSRLQADYDMPAFTSRSQGGGDKGEGRRGGGGGGGGHQRGGRGGGGKRGGR